MRKLPAEHRLFSCRSPTIVPRHADGLYDPMAGDDIADRVLCYSISHGAACCRLANTLCYIFIGKNMPRRNSQQRLPDLDLKIRPAQNKRQRHPPRRRTSEDPVDVLPRLPWILNEAGVWPPNPKLLTDFLAVVPLYEEKRTNPPGGSAKQALTERRWMKPVMKLNNVVFPLPFAPINA